MPRRLWPTVLGLVCLSNWAGSLSAQSMSPPAKEFGTTRHEELRKHYLQLTRERTSRKFIEGFRDSTRGLDLEFIRRVYRVELDPMLASMSNQELDLEIRRLDEIITNESLTYGDEDVMDIFQFTPTVVDPNHPIVTDPNVLTAGASVAAIVYRSSLILDNGKWVLTTGPLDRVAGGSDVLCTFDRYHGDPSAHVAGTGFLIGPDQIATAGHVVSYPPDTWMQSVYFLFGYVLESDGVAKTIYSPDEVYTAQEVSADYNDSMTDWAVIKLERAVVGRTPLPYRTAGKVPSDASLFMLGHPNGLPLKYTGPARLTENTACSRFLTDLDTHPFNSGSPVFNVADGVVEGILVSDLGNFQAFCNCMASATFAPAMGIPGAGVTRILEVAEYLARPGTVVVECRIPVARITSGALETNFTQGQTIEVPLAGSGLDLFFDVDCRLHYNPYPGQTWVIKLAQPGDAVFMQRTCPE